MKMNNLGLAWVLLVGLALGAGGARGGEALSRMPLEDSIPGPGPNRLDRDSTATYEIGAGDVLSVAITFKPAATQRQLLQPGDKLVVSYHFTVSPVGKAYKVDAGDKVYLEFRYSPELSQIYAVTQEDKINVLSRPYLVQPDGTLVLTGITEPVKVAGKTAGEIAKLVSERYKGMLKIPDVTVSVDPQYVYHKTLMGLVTPLDEKKTNLFMTIPHVYVTVPSDGILTLPLLPSLPTAGKTIQQVSAEITEQYRKLNYYLLTVNLWYEEIADQRHAQLRDFLGGHNNPVRCEVLPGGQIALPMIPKYRVAGKSLEAISTELTGLYHKKGLDRVEATVSIEKPRSRVIRVLGEVQAQGVYAIRGQADLWGMIALAGGFTGEADTHGVRIVPAGGKTPRGPFNFANYTESGDPATNPLLSGDETIIVPKRNK